jgi:hypothetical protein
MNRRSLVTPTSYPAQIVFTEVDNVLGPRKWTGRLLRRAACVDATRHNRAVTWTPRFDIVEDPKTGRCVVTMNGGPTPHSKRYANYRDVTTAQKAGIRWAARRFRVPVEIAS